MEERKEAFNDLLNFIVQEELPFENLDKFLQPQSLVPFYGKRKAGTGFLTSSFVMQTPEEAPKAVEEIAPQEIAPQEILPQEVPSEEITPASTTEDTLCVAVISNYEAGSGYTKHTMYEISVKKGDQQKLVAHRFKEFKKLNDKLSKKYPKAWEFPAHGIGVSSVNPKVVQERMAKLDQFLKFITENSQISQDEELIDFLNLN